ncbi:MAG: SsrA-binding protein SmpB [Pseudomonadota bacterium]
MAGKVICQNKKAQYEYFISERYEGGIVLTGSEVKSLRQSKASLTDAYARIIDNEIVLYNMHISPYPYSHHETLDPKRRRKVLMHRQEIKRLAGKVKEKGYSLIPTKVYFKDSWAKVELALAKGKKLYDKRESLKKKDEEREIETRRKH